MQYSIKNYRRISRYYEEIQIAINGYTMYNFDQFALNQILPICNFGRSFATISTKILVT